jgi:hypothetical protein
LLNENEQNGEEGVHKRAANIPVPKVSDEFAIDLDSLPRSYAE